MKRILAVAVVLLCVVNVGLGESKPATRGYLASCDKVWIATKNVVGTLYTYSGHGLHSELSPTEMSGTVIAGGFSGPDIMRIKLVGSGDTCTISVVQEFEGFTHSRSHVRNQLFDYVQKALDYQLTQR